MKRAIGKCKRNWPNLVFEKVKNCTLGCHHPRAWEVNRLRIVEKTQEDQW